MTDKNRNAEELADRLYRELEATEELPVDRTASRWIGEAQAVADAIRGDVPEEVRREGAGDVVRLLSEVEGTGDGRADERVREARKLAETLAQT
ncbi:MAG: hypothetical protein QXG03_07820 [Halalkalicoccus sp.]